MLAILFLSMSFCSHSHTFSKSMAVIWNVDVMPPWLLSYILLLWIWFFHLDQMGERKDK